MFLGLVYEGTWRYNAITTAAFGWVSMAFEAQVYSPLTHADLTEAALSRSVIKTGPNFMSCLGLGAVATPQLYA
jgi:hypothetical protein